MRKYLAAILLAVIVVGARAAAAAPPGGKPKPIDVKGMHLAWDVYRDDGGNYYVSVHEHSDAHDDLVFFGDGKTLYKQSVVGMGSDDHGIEWNLWSPRVVGMNQAALVLYHDKPHLECKQGELRALTPVPADQVKQLIDHATFMPILWQRQTALLARDDDGVYYFVDRLRDEFGGKDYRVYVGQKGAMKELPMTNVVSDSAGAIFATKRGELRIIANEDGKVQWRKGSVRSDLVKLEPQDNRYLIYRELGIYGQLGTVCEDQ